MIYNAVITREKRINRRDLKSHFCATQKLRNTLCYLEVLRDLSHKALERKLANQKLSGLLVLADLTKSDRSGSVSVGLLHATCSGCGLACSLGGELLTRSLSSGRLACGLLGTGHFLMKKQQHMNVHVREEKRRNSGDKSTAILGQSHNLSNSFLDLALNSNAYAQDTRVNLQAMLTFYIKVVSWTMLI